MTEHFGITVRHAQIVDAVAEVILRADLDVACGERALGVVDDATVIGLFEDRLPVLVTHGAGTAVTAGGTDHAWDADLPRFSKGLDIRRFPAIGQAELVFPVPVVVATEATHLVAVVAGHGDCGVVDKVVSDSEAKVGLDDHIDSVLVSPHSATVQADWEVVPHAVQL